MVVKANYPGMQINPEKECEGSWQVDRGGGGEGDGGCDEEITTL